MPAIANSIAKLIRFSTNCDFFLQTLRFDLFLLARKLFVSYFSEVMSCLKFPDVEQSLGGPSCQYFEGENQVW